LGGSRVGSGRLYLNYLIVFTVSGLWHGAAWTFVIWGALHGIYLVLAIMRDKYLPFKLPKNTFLSIIFTFVLVMITWVFFRAKGLYNAKIILSKVFDFGDYGSFSMPFTLNEFVFCWMLMIVLFLKDIFMKEIKTSNTPMFYAKFVGLLLVCYFFGIFSSNQFIYFQF
jgi:alginate O-acetyltransferase complex protein AlgI